MTPEFPIATIKRRPVDPQREQEALAKGFSPIIARIIAGRPSKENESAATLLSPSLKQLDHPQSLADLPKAVARLVEALENNEVIGLETDHDCDGQTSHAVLFSVLTDYFGHPKTHLRSYIGHRLKEGYGLSPKVAKRILDDSPRPTLIITADNGSSDEEQIALLKSHGIDVIVTDHHEIPEQGIPKSALAVINPTREDCQYPDPYIAGCMVAWLFVAATRTVLNETKEQTIPSLAGVLDFVAVGTVADCVSLARSQNNRAVVNYGIQMIARAKRPCWQALIPVLSSSIVSEDLGFKIGPLLNSDGRLSSAFGSVSFLLSENIEEARRWVTYLQEQNTERKKVQTTITEAATEQAIVQFQENKRSLCLFLEDGHAGVHGISASRIKDLFGRPVIIFCPKMEDKECLTGSARSIDGLHLREVLQTVSDRHPTLIQGFGGHRGAAGLSIMREHLTPFSIAFEEAVCEKLSNLEVGPVVFSDGFLPPENVSCEFVDELNSALEPYGREFEPPYFELKGEVVSFKTMGQTGTHARVGLAIGDLWLELVWFNFRRHKDSPIPVEVGDCVEVVFSPKTQIFRGQRQLSCQVIHLTISSFEHAGASHGNRTVERLPE